MKKLLTILAVLASAFFYSCNSEKDPPKDYIVAPSTDQPASKVNADTSKHLEDAVLESPEMEKRLATMKGRRKRPTPPPAPPPYFPPPAPPKPNVPPPPAPVIEVCVFLDYDGHTTSGTVFNNMYTQGKDIVSQPSGLTPEQKKEILDSVRMDYKNIPNVYVTDDSTIFLKYAPYKRMRVVFTIANGWYPTNVGGVSFLNSLAWGDGTPCFVFTGPIGLSKTRNISISGTHEAGHTFGLVHQDIITAVMYPRVASLFPTWVITPNQNDTLVINTSIRR